MSSSSLAPPSVSASSTKEAFNAALRSRSPDNKYIAHLKIWETLDETGGATGAQQRKARYLILAVQHDATGRVTLNKAKRNANGSFSIGKDWDVNTLREIAVHQPDAFTITLSRGYSWQTERPREQLLFLQSLVKVYRKYTRDIQGPRCIGLEMPEAAPQPPQQPTAEISMPSAPSSDSLSTRTSAPAPVLSLNTAVTRPTVLRDSPSRTPTTRGGVGVDGFYDPRTRDSSSVDSQAPIRPSNGKRLQSYESTRSSGGEAVVPSIVLPNPEPAAPQQGTTRRERSPLGLPPPSTEETPNKELGVPTSKSDTTTGRTSPAGSASSKTEVGTTVAAAATSQIPPPRTTLSPAPTRPAKKRSASTDQGAGSGTGSTATLGASSSGGGGGNGGDARARLSAVEPVRGGAAYERMLLAGTGLAGVTEGDEDEEDAYGGTSNLTNTDEANPAGEGAHSFKPPPRARRRRTLSVGRRPSKATLQRLDSDEKSGSGVGAAQDEDEEEDTTLLNVEEILEGFEWGDANAAASAALSDVAGAGGITLRRGAGATTAGKGHADVIEARLLDELAALDAANIHAIIESDDRVNIVVRHMEEALAQLDAMDSMIAGFKVQLNARADDISHIESQNRGLQVHTSNQRTLAGEIEKLLSTVHVDDDAVGALMYAGLSDDEGIAHAEHAAGALYKAMLQARRTHDEREAGTGAEMTMAAATERLDEYEHLAENFAKRLLQHLTREFNEQTQRILTDPQRSAALQAPSPTLRDHAVVEEVLGRYCGLLLYAKEVSPALFQRISAAYFASANERYRAEMARLFAVWKEQLRRPTEDETAEASFALPSGPSAAAALRGGTIRRAVGGKERGAKGSRGGEVNGYEAFYHLLSAIVPLVTREEAFIADLLHINDNAVTFADYAALEPYFRRRAAAIFGDEALASSGPLREMKGALDLIFSFLAPEWQSFADLAIQYDRIQIVGILAALDRAIVEAEELSSEFLLRSLAKLHMRLAALLERFVAEQIKAIEQTKLTVKKRKGVAHFIRVFPVWVERIEAQLINAESLNIRAAMDGYYEQISHTMFDALQAMAKMEGTGTSADEDKSALNHHVILIENMFHFVRECKKLRNPALQPLIRRAEAIYEDHKAAYVHSVLRRPLGKTMDFGDGIDALLRSTPANEVSLHSAYAKSAFKKQVKENGAKDVRKAIEALSKRVQKHFGLEDDEASASLLSVGVSGGGGGTEGGAAAADEAAEVLARVWKACEEAFVREVERQGRIARDCYSGAVVVELTTDDVKRPFTANAPRLKR